MSPIVCLGTAQFGMPYGITNAAGQVLEAEVRELLLRAASAGLTYLDTAQAYGSAEVVLGRSLSPGHGFKLISKLHPQIQTNFTALDCFIWEKAFKRSLVCLGQTSIDALLLHNPGDLRKPGGEHLREWLFSLRDRGLVRRLGISIYDSCDLDGVSPELLDLVQLPMSLYDQRLLSDGTVARLRAQGCEIHARSLYLQGLLLSPTANWPAWADPADRDHHARLEKLAADRGSTLLDCAIGFARAQQDLEAVVIGLCSRRELEQLLQAWNNSSPWNGTEWSQWSLDRSEILDPRRWPQSKA
jgi:aryl-alcohol dehydrogenase-like predicted oxidoreductase